MIGGGSIDGGNLVLHGVHQLENPKLTSQVLALHGASLPEILYVDRRQDHVGSYVATCVDFSTSLFSFIHLLCQGSTFWTIA